MNKKTLLLGIGGAFGAAVAWKMLSRAATVNWEDFPDIHHAENSRFAEVDGITAHYQEFGDASDPAIILIHGYSASTYVWQTVAPPIADAGFHVIAVDLPGFGFSEKPAWYEYSIGAQARFVTRLLNVLGIGRAALVGSSYGGAVAATIALDYAERVERLVLVDAVINDEAKNNPLLRLAEIRGLGELATPFLLGSKRFFRRRMRGTLAPANHHLITDERINSIRRPLNAADAHYSMLATSRNWDANRIEEDAHLISQPTLIIWGDQDKVVRIENGEKLYHSILNSRMVVFRDCGHVPPEENPELFVELVTDFCR